MDKKPVILSGIQPSGHLCVANYMGALPIYISLYISNIILIPIYYYMFIYFILEKMMKFKQQLMNNCQILINFDEN